MTWIPKNDFFLQDISLEILQDKYSQEKNGKAKLRLLTCIKRKKGDTLDEIALSINKPKTTIHDWLKRIESNKLDSCYDKKQKGNRSKLTFEQKEALKRILEESPQKQNIPYKLWDTKLVQYIIAKMHKINYTQSAIWKLTKKLKFSLKVPRPKHPKTNTKVQEQFKKKLKKEYNITLNQDSRYFVLTKHTSS